MGETTTENEPRKGRGFRFRHTVQFTMWCRAVEREMRRATFREVCPDKLTPEQVALWVEYRMSDPLEPWESMRDRHDRFRHYCPFVGAGAIED